MAAKKPRHTFGKLTRSSRDRIAREAAAYGLSRRSAREMYNRGTFNPFSRNPELHVPLKIRKQGIVRDRGPVDIEYLRQRAYDHMEASLGYEAGAEVYNYSPATVWNNVWNHMSREALIAMITANADDLRELAAIQTRSEITPRLLNKFGGLNRKNFGWLDHERTWHNNFWYH